MSKDTVISGLMGKGWTKEQATGVAANIEQESRFNPAAIGDGGKAHGIAQWHPDRQANFQAQYGKPLKGIKDFNELVQFYRDLSAKQAKKFPDRCLKLSEVKGKPLTLKAAINGEG